MFAIPPAGYREVVGLTYDYDNERGSAPDGTVDVIICPDPLHPGAFFHCAVAGPVGTGDSADIAAVMSTIPDEPGRLYEIGIGYSTGSVRNGWLGCGVGCSSPVLFMHLGIDADLRDGDGNPASNFSEVGYPDAWATIPAGGPPSEPSYVFLVNPDPPAAIPGTNTAREQLFERDDIPDFVNIEYHGQWTRPVIVPPGGSYYRGAVLNLIIRAFDPLPGGAPEPADGFMCVV